MARLTQDIPLAKPSIARLALKPIVRTHLGFRSEGLRNGYCEERILVGPYLGVRSKGLRDGYNEDWVLLVASSSAGGPQSLHFATRFLGNHDARTRGEKS